MTSSPETRGDGSHRDKCKTGRLGADDIVISTTCIEGGTGIQCRDDRVVVLVWW